MEILMKAIGVVRSQRAEAVDDGWLGVRSWIDLDESLGTDCLRGLEAFSHIEVLYHFHKVDEGKIVYAAEHPRENPAWPSVGIFAQRKKARPNRIGATICRIQRIEGSRISVEGLDAIDGTPVLDIKPVMREYLPRGSVEQPAWVGEMMREYWEK